VTVVIWQDVFGIVILSAFVALPVALVTATVKLKGEPANAVGVPEITPVAESRANPAGSAPAEILKLGEVQFVVPMVCEYGVPIVPAGREAVEIEHDVSGISAIAPTA